MIITLYSLLALSTLGYGLFALYSALGLLKKSRTGNNDSKPSVAVVIAARNEESNIEKLLSDLADQDYSGQLDIYVADDRSTDSTGKLIDKYAHQHDNFHSVKILERSTHMTPKKNALTECIKRTTAEIILSTDADCRLGTSWVSAAVPHFDEDTGILVGYSEVDSSSLFAEYQALDFAAIMVTNAGMMVQGYAWSGSGQNLAYRRSAFTQIGGFNPVASRVSGDDVYLVQTISRKTDFGAKFIFDQRHFVKTAPMDSVKAFINQRIRWSSNSRGLEKNDPLFFSFLLTAFLTNFLILLGILTGLNDMGLWIPIIVKFFIEGLVLILGARTFGYWHLIKWFPVWFIVQPVYITCVGLLGLRGKFTWKP